MDQVVDEGAVRPDPAAGEDEVFAGQVHRQGLLGAQLEVVDGAHRGDGGQHPHQRQALLIGLRQQGQYRWRVALAVIHGHQRCPQRMRYQAGGRRSEQGTARQETHASRVWLLRVESSRTRPPSSATTTFLLTSIPSAGSSSCSVRIKGSNRRRHSWRLTLPLEVRGSVPPNTSRTIGCATRCCCQRSALISASTRATSSCRTERRSTSWATTSCSLSSS